MNEWDAFLAANWTRKHWWSVNWRAKPWWLRPLIGCTLGFTAGLVVSQLIDRLPADDQPLAWGIAAGLAIALILQAWWALAKANRQLQVSLANLAAVFAEDDPLLGRRVADRIDEEQR